MLCISEDSNGKLAFIPVLFVLGGVAILFVLGLERISG